MAPGADPNIRTGASIAEELAWTGSALASPETAGCWRIWHYGQPEIVLGCSQRRLYEKLEADGGSEIPLFRRASGGGVVFAGPWLLGITVVLPDGHPLLSGASLVDSYRWLGELHARVLSDAGIDARALDAAQARGGSAAGAGVSGSSSESASAARSATASGQFTPVDWACFGGLSPWEVVDSRGRKLTGLSQRRVRGAIAWSAGTLLSRPDWQRLCDAIRAPSADAAALDAFTAACAELAPVPDGAGWAERFAGALDRALDGGTDPR